ncbi:hypothetical protein ACFJIV_11035 [Mucilaginibacter sp. UC70_90]
MEFKFQDILKNIIPGMVVLVGVIILFLTDITSIFTPATKLSEFKEFAEVIFLLIVLSSYLLGYINDAISSLLEYYVIYHFFGTPSLKLLKGTGKRIFLAKPDEILQYIKTTKSLNSQDVDLIAGRWFFQKDFRTSKLKARVLFKHANNMKDLPSQECYKDKIREYYNSYVFSRNIFFSICFTLAVIVFSYFKIITFKIWVILALILLLFAIRRRDKSYYYSRQILLACKP